MGITVEQWRASIGRWCGGVSSANCSSEVCSSEVSDCIKSSTPWHYLLVLAALLVIAGVELNPGPGSQQTGLSTKDKTQMSSHCWQGAALNTTQANFSKLQGTSGLGGQFFEIKLLSLIYLRALDQGLSFSMASNVKEYQKFDDVVFQFDQGQETCFFLQLKHKENVKSRITRQTFLQEKSDFSLFQYYKSYVNIQDYLRDKVGDNFKNYLFILFTSADVEEKLKNKKIPDIGSEKFLMTCPDRILKFDKTEHSFIYEQLKDLPKHVEFLSQLRVMYGQKTENEMDSLVKEELLKTNADSSDVDSLYKLYHNHVQEWWLGNFRLTQDENDLNPLTRAKHEMSTNLLGLRRADIIWKGIRFQESVLRELWVQIKGNKVTVVYAPGNNATVTTAKVLQVLSGTSKHLLVNSTDLSTQSDAILSDWRQGRYDVLVVECTNGVELNIYQQIATVLNEGKNLIFISKWMPDLNEIQYIRFIFGTHLTEVRDCVKLEDFVPETREVVVRKNILFQGVESCLSSLISDSKKDDVDSLDAEIVALVLGQEEFQIGSALQQSLEYYVDRTLMSKSYVSNDILSEAGSLFAVLNTSKSELQKLVPPGESVCNVSEWHSGCRYVVINDLQSFINLSLQVSIVHCLCRLGEALTWIQSKGNLDTVRRHLCTDMSAEWRPNTTLEGEARVILVTAEPGMGKSSLVTYLANQTKKLDPTMWVVRLNVNAHTKALQDIKINGFTHEKAVELLAEAAGVEKQGLGWKLFTKTLISGSNMVVLVDGVDEVSLLYFGQVVQIVEWLSKTRILKIWVTGRPHMKKQLEDTFGRPTFSLKPFSAEDAKSFLVKFWGCKNRHYTEEFLKNAAESVIELADRSVGYDEKIIVGVPLQTYMLAEVLETYLANMDTLPKYINLFILLNKFVEKKWEIYINEKKMADNTNMNVILGNEIERKIFMQVHKLAALVTILSEREFFSHLTKEELSDIKNSRIERTGIVVDVVDGRPQFVHRTFAEYFTATWFAEHLPQSKEFLSGHLLTERFQVVRRILDYILTEDYPLHLAAMNGKVEHTLCDQVDVLDRGGRTALHLAVTYKHHDVSRLLLDKGCDISVVDNVLGWTVMQYAEMQSDTGDWDTMLVLLNARPELRDDVFGKDIITQYYGFVYHFMPTIRLGLLPLLKYMVVDRGVDVDFRPDFGPSPLHHAAIHGKAETVHWLINFLNGASESESNIVNITDHNGGTPLHMAMDFGNVQGVRALLAANCDVNASDRYGCTPLYRASQRGYEQVVREVLAANCDVNKACKCGWTPLFVASLHGHARVANIIHNSCSGNTTALDTPALLAVSGCDLNSADEFCSTPLHVASEYGNVEAVRFLISAGCDVNRTDAGVRTPLRAALENGNVEVVRLLISAGCDVNIVDKYGSTPLHYVSEHGVVELVEILAGAPGCDINITDPNGRTPLHVASERGSVQVVRFLIGVGCDTNASDAVGQTPLSAAVQRGHREVADVLKATGAT